MSEKPTDYSLTNQDGVMRRVGFEIEYIDYSLNNSVKLVHKLFGGAITPENEHLIHIKKTALGRFSVERDLNLLQSLSAQSIKNQNSDALDLEGIANKLLTPILKNIVPIEIVTPPLPFNDISAVSNIIEELKKSPAKDTNKNILFAFGIHINPEVPDFAVTTILNYLRAYCLLSAWLRETIGLDPTRKLLPFIDEYPQKFIQAILDKDYQPNITSLINDYVKYNHTRNRALDLLPLFKHLAKKQIDNLLPKENIKARPTFHYRLPNTNFCDDNWSIYKEWDRWLSVEKLANRPTLIQEMTALYLDHSKRFFNRKQDWIQETQCFLKKLEK